MIRDHILAGLNRLFRLRGMELRALPTVLNDASMEAGLARAARLAPEIATVIDAGAAAGHWTRRALRHFPSARHLLIEPLAEREAELAALRAQHPQVEFVLAAAGAERGDATLNVAGNLDSSGIYGDAFPNGRRVPVTTIDHEVAARKLRAPFLLKLDTHGYDMAILAGAAATLAQSALLIIEANNFVVTPSYVLFYELCAWLEPRGFRPCDLLDPMRRPCDGVLWQMDLVFARCEHPAFSSASYR